MKAYEYIHIKVRRNPDTSDWHNKWEVCTVDNESVMTISTVSSVLDHYGSLGWILRDFQVIPEKYNSDVFYYAFGRTL